MLVATSSGANPRRRSRSRSQAGCSSHCKTERWSVSSRTGICRSLLDLELELALADEAAETDDLRKLLVVLEAADDFFVPRLARLPIQAGPKFREFRLDSLQS